MSVSTSKQSPDFWLGVTAAIAVPATIVPLVLLRSWVLATLWGWYVVPAFGVQPLRVVYAFGLALLATYALPRRNRTDDSKKGFEGFVETAVEGVVFAVFVLAMGWVGTWFI